MLADRFEVVLIKRALKSYQYLLLATHKINTIMMHITEPLLYDSHCHCITSTTNQYYTKSLIKQVTKYASNLDPRPTARCCDLACLVT